MKKKAFSQARPFLKISIFLVTIFFVSGVFAPKAHAQLVDVCIDDTDRSRFLLWKFETKTFCNVRDFVAEGVDVFRTVMDITKSFLVGVPLAVLLNTNADDYGVCGAYWLTEARNQVAGVGGSGSDVLLQTDPGGSTQNLMTTEEYTNLRAEATNMDCNFDQAAIPGRAAGSVTGVTMLAYESITTQPVPVNLAYYTKHNLRKIPVIKNTAYASQTTAYNAFGLELIISIWETTRNLAYAMMSIIMLIIGIMITTRRKISPHAVVTAQMAIPRVIISLLLITFSYPIGAIFASAILPITWGLYRFLFGDFVQSVVDIFSGQPGRLFNVNILIMIGAIATRLLGSAGFAVVITVTLIALTIVAMFVAVVKLLIINLKILMQIVIAPIQFALAAVPGQEHLITDWFKQIIAKVLGVPAIIFIINFAWYILLKPFIDPDTYRNIFFSNTNIATGFFQFARGSASLAMSFIALPLMSVIVMFYSFKADKKIEEFILGSGGKRGRR